MTDSVADYVIPKMFPDFSVYLNYVMINYDDCVQNSPTSLVYVKDYFTSF